MKLYEYQGKEIFSEFKIPVPRGKAVRDAEAAQRVAHEIGGPHWVVKAQILAGGRGKSGGVRIADTPQGVFQTAEEMLGVTLVTPQTGPLGNRVCSVLVEEAVSIKEAFYVGVAVDRERQCPVFMVSKKGGTEIEELAASHPECVVREWIEMGSGLQVLQMRNLLHGVGLDDRLVQTGERIFSQVYGVFESLDCMLVEMNPLVVTDNGRLLALDAKIDVDGNALYRHQELLQLLERDERDPIELEASRQRLTYVPLEGNVGIMANGAGLAMATMDLIKQAGASPANFLDLGGGTTAERISKGFEIVLGNENVRVVFLNIFGGILRCDVLAQGVVEASRKAPIKVPVVVRFEGTNKEEGRRILAQGDLGLIVADSMADAAEKIRRIVL